MNRPPVGVPLAEFQDTLTKSQRALGFIYLTLHILALPILLAMLQEYSPGMDEYTVNVAYYALGMGFCLIFMWSFLRMGFDIFLDGLPRCMIAIALAYMIQMFLSIFAGGAVLLLPWDMTALPAIEESQSFVQQYYWPSIAMLGIMAPIIEEVLFRGVLFGSLLRKNKTLAYVLSIALFGLSHVWQGALATMDMRILIFAIMDIPMGFALAWSYEKSGSIWVPIFLHMLVGLLG